MASGSYSTGTWTSRTKNSWDEGGFNKRHNFTSLSDDQSRESRIDPSESRSDPFDLDTSTLYFNVTILQKSCKKLNILKTKLEKKRKKKEKNKNSHQEDSKDFKKKKEAYREVYNEILAERAAVESIFHKSGRSTNDNQTRRQTASERQKPKSLPHLPQMDTEECEKCQQKETNIWKLKNDIDKSRNDARDLQHKINALETQIANERSDKEDALRRLNSMASAKLRYNNPNIADFSDPNRPTKIAEKLSEIYDNEWTDAFDHLEMTHSKIEEENVQLLLNVLIEVHQHCNNQYEDILSKITAPLKPQDIPPEVGNDLKNAVKRLAQFKLPAVAKEIKSNLPRRFVNAGHLFQHPGDAFDIYIDKCIDACLHMSVQDPPMYLSAVPNKDGLFSNALYKEYTKSGKYEVFIVWPVLYLHRNGQIMTQGVAQGTDDNILIKNNLKQRYQQSAPSHYVARRQQDYKHGQQHQHEQDRNQYSGMKTSTDEIFRSRNDARDLQHKINALETQIANERSDKEDALRRLSSMASAKPRYNNPNIDEQLSDPNRPTKIAEELSEIYDNEWADAFDHLEINYGKNEEDNVQLLLNILIEVYQQCNNQYEDILSKIIAPIKPQDIPPEVSNDLKNAVKRFAQFKMPVVAKEIKSNLPRRFVNAGHLFQHPGDAFDIYIDKCIDACLHMSVQDPPMYLSADPNKDGLFSNALYKAYTKSGKYEVFIVWPVLYLHRNGQIMTQGVAQGTDDNIMIKNNSKQSYQQSAPSHNVARSQHDYEHRQQHQQEQYLNQNRGMQTTYGLPTNNRVPKYPSHYRGQEYSN